MGAEGPREVGLKGRARETKKRGRERTREDERGRGEAPGSSRKSVCQGLMEGCTEQTMGLRRVVACGEEKRSRTKRV